MLARLDVARCEADDLVVAAHRLAGGIARVATLWPGGISPATVTSRRQQRAADELRAGDDDVVVGCRRIVIEVGVSMGFSSSGRSCAATGSRQSG